MGKPDLSVQGKLATPVTLNLGTGQAQLLRVAGDERVTGKNVPAETKATVAGSARADWTRENATADLSVKLDDSSVDAKVAVAHWSAPPSPST